MADNNYIHGIDVAKWQGTIDWRKVAGTQKFAILKITQKDNKVEGAFERNYSGATAAGLLVGGYRYVYATNIAQARDEAYAMVNVLRKRDMPVGIWLDMEDSTIRNLGKTKLWEIIAEETKILRSAGYSVGIYCNKDWYDNVLNGKALAAEFPFWIARYPASDNGTIKESINPKSLSHCTAWQYTQKGKVAGITGYVDMDVVYR